MLPLRDNIPVRKFPVVNNCLIAANVLVFIYEWRLGAHQQLFLIHYGFIPLRFSLSGGGTLGVLTIFTSMFLHGSLLHLLSN
ncbi:MAG: rhomboid family intramembrane serine protease, partial [Deltaproteobacteria bacterium]